MSGIALEYHLLSDSIAFVISREWKSFTINHMIFVDDSIGIISFLTQSVSIHIFKKSSRV